MFKKPWQAGSLLTATAMLAVGAMAAPLKNGQAAPAWSGKTVQGKPIKSTQLKGKAVLMNFFGFT